MKRVLTLVIIAAMWSAMSPRLALADAGTALVFAPGAASAPDASLLTAVKDLTNGLAKCPGWTAIFLDLSKALPKTFGSESADVFISTQSGASPQVVVTFTDSNHQRIGLTTIKTPDVAATNLCSFLPPLVGADDSEPLRSPNFFSVIPDGDTDRPFADLLLFRLRQFGYDGQLTATNFDQSATTLSLLCASKRRALRYHVIQDNTEQKNRGSTQVTTAIGASLLKCGGADSNGKFDSQPLDSLAAAPRVHTHYVSFGTLVSTIIGIAVALKPKISTPQLTTAEPLITAFIDQPNTLTQANRDAVSEGFRVMLCGLKYADGAAPNLTIVTPTPPPRGSSSPEYDVAQKLGCVGSRFSRTPTGALRAL